MAEESSVKEKREQKELWREEASSQLAFRSSFMNCRSAITNIDMLENFRSMPIPISDNVLTYQLQNFVITSQLT